MAFISEQASQVKVKAEQLRGLNNPPLELSLERILHPPTTTKLEHHVASWAATMAIQVFQEVNNDKGLPQWIFTPEQRDEESGKISDLVLEVGTSLQTDGWWTLREALVIICMEFKRLEGNPLYKAFLYISIS